MSRGWYENLSRSLRVGIRKFIELTRAWGKKIYWPEGQIFGPKQRFFKLRVRIHGQYQIMTRCVGKQGVQMCIRYISFPP